MGRLHIGFKCIQLETLICIKWYASAFLFIHYILFSVIIF